MLERGQDLLRPRKLTERAKGKSHLQQKGKTNKKELKVMKVKMVLITKEILP